MQAVSSSVRCVKLFQILSSKFASSLPCRAVPRSMLPIRSVRARCADTHHTRTTTVACESRQRDPREVAAQSVQ